MRNPYTFTCIYISWGLANFIYGWFHRSCTVFWLSLSLSNSNSISWNPTGIFISYRFLIFAIPHVSANQQKWYSRPNPTLILMKKGWKQFYEFLIQMSQIFQSLSTFRKYEEKVYELWWGEAVKDNTVYWMVIGRTLRHLNSPELTHKAEGELFPKHRIVEG